MISVFGKINLRFLKARCARTSSGPGHPIFPPDLTLSPTGRVAVTPDLARKAVDGCRGFGKIVGHGADFNFGDCFAYAHAQAQGEPLLFLGDDSTPTDVRSALIDPPARLKACSLEDARS